MGPISTLLQRSGALSFEKFPSGNKLWSGSSRALPFDGMSNIRVVEFAVEALKNTGILLSSISAECSGLGTH
jgi:hypothetical protein